MTERKRWKKVDCASKLSKCKLLQVTIQCMNFCMVSLTSKSLPFCDFSVSWARWAAKRHPGTPGTDPLEDSVPSPRLFIYYIYVIISQYFNRSSTHKIQFQLRYSNHAHGSSKHPKVECDLSVFRRKGGYVVYPYELFHIIATFHSASFC